MKVEKVKGVKKQDENVEQGEYKVQRKIYLYVKKENMGVIKGIKEYVELLMKDKMIGKDGKIEEYGMVKEKDEESEEKSKELREGKKIDEK